MVSAAIVEHKSFICATVIVVASKHAGQKISVANVEPVFLPLNRMASQQRG